jgi:hypothetical protein
MGLSKTSKEKIVQETIDKLKKEYGKVVFTSKKQKHTCSVCSKRTTRSLLAVYLLLSNPTKPSGSEPDGSWCCDDCKRRHLKSWALTKEKVNKQFLDYVCSKQCEIMLILKYS